MAALREYGDSPYDRRSYRRGAGRIPQLTLCVTEESFRDVEILDESLTGISVLLMDALDIEVGQEVQLSHGERSVQAVVKTVQPRQGGGLRVGLQWGPCEIQPASLLFLLPVAH